MDPECGVIGKIELSIEHSVYFYQEVACVDLIVREGLVILSPVTLTAFSWRQ